MTTLWCEKFLNFFVIYIYVKSFASVGKVDQDDLAVLLKKRQMMGCCACGCPGSCGYCGWWDGYDKWKKENDKF